MKPSFYTPESFTLYLLLFILSIPISLSSQSCQDASVEVSAEVQADPPRITINWVSNAGTLQYTVHRKLKTGLNWGATLATLAGSSTQYVDSTVTIGTSYEYRITRTSQGLTGYGYIHSGIEIPAVESRGRLILVVDDTFKDSLYTEINRLIDDLEGDGWQVVHLNVNRNAVVTDIRSMIVNVYNENPVNTKAVFLLGHVPVPYSGNINPDGHPDHQGAWPADVYYADVNGNWTDNAINNTVAADARHDNVPEDGKFDQSLLPNDVELQIGRVDFANMPSFADSEQQLLKNYLDKDHAYRHKLFSPVYRGVVDDNFGFFGTEAFAASGWKNFGPLVGPGNVIANDYFETTRDSSYLWSYGCGGGWYQGASGIGSTTDFANTNLQSVFTMLFGSYFGDWDSQDNFLRAALAQGKTLTNAWSGRPHWAFHHMGLGENIGYSTRVTQNNNATYFPNYGARFVHIALMGDPTLRNDVVAPVPEVFVWQNEIGSRVSWLPSPDPVAGYYVYRRSGSSQEFIRINNEPVMETFFDDPCVPDSGDYRYMVRAITLQTSSSGTYYNLSQGIALDFHHTGPEELIAEATWFVNGNEVTFFNFSSYADNYFWDFGDGHTSTESDPTHVYLDGFFNGYMVAYNGCGSDTIYFDFNIFTGVKDIKDDPSIVITPNPSTGKFNIKTERPVPDMNVQIYNLSGQKLLEYEEIRSGDEINLSALAEGMYIVHILKDDVKSMKRLVIQR